jgi:histidine ammonia-lyase
MALALALAWSCGAFAAPTAIYQTITPSEADRTIVLTGKTLTIDQVVSIARHGAKVALSPEARQRSEDGYGLLLEAAAEGIPVYWFNRGAGSEREVAIFEGDPMSPKNKAFLEAHQLATFKGAGVFSYGPEVAEEEVVRAMMAVRANAMTFDAPSPQLTQMLLDLLNKRITPVVNGRGTVGEGDLGLLGNIGAAMIGEGEVYYNGVRMPAAEALAKAGLKPLKPFAADDNALTSSDAYATARAALLVHDAEALLNWGDLVYAIDLVGMNSSVTPMSLPVQSNRPFPWINYDSARVMDMIKGSYLFDADAKRIIQDPESMRASPLRAGSAWLAWSRLRDTVTIQLNSSDHNPAVRTDLKPGDSWELSTPQMMKYHVKGGVYSHGKSGYILSNANWDPYPLANDVESFTIALANYDVVIVQRIERFDNAFFTVITPDKVMKPAMLVGAPLGGGGYLTTDLWQEIVGAMMPVPPEGNAVVATVEDLQAQTRLKLDRAIKAVDNSFHLAGLDLISGAFWVDVRRAQDPSRNVGPGPTAVLAALRKTVPLGAPPASPQAGYDFIKATSAASLYKSPIAMPPGEPTPVAQMSIAR